MEELNNISPEKYVYKLLTIYGPREVDRIIRDAEDKANEFCLESRDGKYPSEVRLNASTYRLSTDYVLVNNQWVFPPERTLVNIICYFAKRIWIGYSELGCAIPAEYIVAINTQTGKVQKLKPIEKRFTSERHGGFGKLHYIDIDEAKPPSIEELYLIRATWSTKCKVPEVFAKRVTQLRRERIKAVVDEKQKTWEMTPDEDDAYHAYKTRKPSTSSPIDWGPTIGHLLLAVGVIMFLVLAVKLGISLTL